MEETKMPRGANPLDQMADELEKEMTMKEAAMSLSPKELKSIQRAARRMGRKSLASQADFTCKQHDPVKAKRKRKIQKQSRKKNRK